MNQMITPSEKVRTLENIGLIDRLFRFIIGGAALGYFVLYGLMQHPHLSMTVQVTITALALYPLITAMMGWDPVYAVFGARSCSSTGRHQCGTLPYQFKAIMGHAPKYCESETEHSLEACHDDTQERPHHTLWKVEQEPMLYPDDATLDAYVRKQERKERVRQHKVKAA
jgi:hypothetical protein